MGKQLVIIGADFSAVAIGTAKVLDHITASIVGDQYTNTAPTGLTVTAYYTAASGGGSSVVTGYTTNPTVWRNTVGQQTMDVSYTRGSVTATTTVTADVQEGTGPTPPVGSYTVSANITDGTAASVQVASGGTATLTVVPDSGHTNPTSVTISSGTATSATISGATITVTNVTSDVVLAATCPASGSVVWTYRAGWTESMSSSSRFLVGYHGVSKNNGFAMQLPAGTYNRLELAISGEYKQSGSVIISKAASQGASTVTNVQEIPFSTQSSSPYQIITLTFEPITFTNSEFLVLEPSINGQAMGTRTGAYDLWYAKRPTGDTSHPGFYNRVPVVPTGGASTAWYDVLDYSIDFGIGYSSTM